MPNILNENGMQIKTQAEMQATIYGKLKTIYGADIYLGSDSPDAQNANIFILEALDVLELVLAAYNSFDPDKAIGRVLDQRIGINGLQRKGGTYTIQSVTVVVNQALTLFGLDQEVEDAYTVADDSGTEFQLGVTIDLPSAGSYSLVFQAALPGKTETLANTITNPITVVIGVLSVNNPSGPISIGINEETDAQVRIRRQQSTAISSQGWKDGLEADLKNINGINDAKVYENRTNTNPDSHGIPAHYIWVIVSGVYNDSEVANSIYVKRNMGPGMKGEKTYNYLQKDGSNFVVQWDDVAEEQLFIKLVLEAIDPTKPVDNEGIRARLPNLFTSSIGGIVNINEISTLVREIDPNALVIAGSGLALSSAGPFLTKLSTSAKNKQFVLSSTNVIILPILVYPVGASVVGGVTPATRTFVAYGGFGTYSWNITVNNSSGASIDPVTGLYTPGSVTGVTDTVEVTDGLGNVATQTIEVV